MHVRIRRQHLSELADDLNCLRSAVEKILVALRTNDAATCDLVSAAAHPHAEEALRCLPALSLDVSVICGLVRVL